MEHYEFDSWQDEEEFLIDGVGFADPTGVSALRAATPENPRNHAQHAVNPTVSPRLIGLLATSVMPAPGTPNAASERRDQDAQ